MLSPIIKDHIESKLGKSIRYHSDCEHLSIEIEKHTRQKVSVNTLKRLFGIISGVCEPRLYTLDTIAIYLGYGNWDVYLQSLDKLGNSDLNPVQQTEIRVESLLVNSIVEFGYAPDRLVQMKYEGDKIFKVTASTNSKLLVDDMVEVSYFILYYPLLVTNLTRNGVTMGRFTAGKVGGLTHLKLI
jgi:hypothetical protein